MKKLFAMLCLLAVVGFGCAPSEEPSTPAPEDTVSTTQETPAPTPEPEPTPAPTPDPAKEEIMPEETTPSDGLKPFPPATPPAVAIDDSTWTQTVTRSGVTITAPTRGTYAPTWTYTNLSSSDANIVNNCYVTADIVYKQSNSPREGYCHTATTFNAEAGTRTDYYLAVGISRIDLWTFTKTYPAGFNHNDYTATLDYIINILD